jgi:hypothetical protein
MAQTQFPIHIRGMKPTVPTALSGPASPVICAEVTGANHVKISVTLVEN